MILYDTFTVDGVRRTADGYLAAFARVARTGVQTYKGSELGRPDLETVRVYRPAEEVFHADALRSFAHRPVTLRHPSVPVTAKNWKKHAGGQTGDEVVRDGEYVRVPMVMMDQALIDAYERDGIRELSMGYSTDIKWVTGVTDSGEDYDAVQTAIRGNHLAVVPVARGGDQLRIGDEDLEDDKDKLGHGSYKRGGKKKDDPEDKGHYVEPDSHGGGGYKVQYGPGGIYHRGIYSTREEAEKAAKFYNDKNKKTKDSVSDGTKTCPECGASVPQDATECPECGYDFDNVNDSTGEYTMKLAIDGLTVNVADDQSGGIIEKHIASLTKQVADAGTAATAAGTAHKAVVDELATVKKAVDAKDGEIAVLKKQVTDAAVTPEKLDVLVKDRLAVTDRAKVLLGDKYVFDGKTIDQIRRDSVAAKLGDAAKTMNDAAIEGAFAALTAGVKTETADSQIGAALLHRPHSATQLTDARDAAHAEMTKRTGEAWKTPASH